MNNFLALLRGINVSGQKRILMSDLKHYMEECGFSGVSTYIQSGNVVFKSQTLKLDEIRDIIEKKIREKYGFDVPVLVLRRPDLEHVLKNNPYPMENSGHEQRFYIAFLYEEPSQANLEILENVSFPSEFIKTDGKFIYMFFPNGYGRAKINNNFIENKLKVLATTRNWKSVNTLYEMLSA